MSDKPRYSRISDILDLAIFMSSKIQGVTITEIAQSEMILSSSLHGLIIADAFRIPNKRIYFTEAPLGSGIKFDDYYSAYGVMAPAHRIKSVEDVPEKNHILDSYFISDAMVSKMQKDMYHCMNQYLKNRAIK